MTSGTFWTAVLRKGKQVLQQVGKGKAQKVSAKVGRTQLQQQVQAVHSAKGLVQNVSGRLHLYWQESIRNVYFRTLASQLGRQAFHRGGRNVSLLAFAGLVFSQKDEDVERIHTFLSAPIYNKEASLENPVFSMRHLEFGCRLGQGCNAVVYDARLKADQNSEEAKDFESHKDSSAFTDVPEEEKTNKAMELTGIEVENEKIPYKMQHTSSSTNISENFDEEVNSDTFSQADSELSILDLTDDEAQQGDRTPIVFETFNASANIINFTEGDAYTADNVSETDSEISILDESDDGLDEEDRAPLLFPVQPVNLISLDWEMAEYSDSDYSLTSDNANSYFFNILGDELKKSEDNLTFSDNNAIFGMSFAEKTLFSSTAAGTSTIAVSSPSTSSESVLSDTDNAEESALTFDKYKKFPMLEMSVDQVVKWQNLTTENNLQYLSLNSSFSTESSGRTCEKGRYELAVKMMFNYDFESNCDKILRGMCKEAVPALLTGTSEQLEMFYTRHNVRLKHLPAHPNIVEMLGLFVDQIPDLPDGLMNYPAALPERINPHGIGRNMTLFLVMKKYSMTLSEYLSVVHLSVKERLYLLLQLLEAVDHLVHHGIAHRDIKADNVLLDTSKDGPPQVVLADFGCCLADPHHGLWLPFPTDEVDRGGNSALMAPEIASAIAGPFVTLDYSKADLWGVGALAYEILGAENPFYTNSKGGKLDSRSYKMEDLPPLPDSTPQVVQQLVNALLEKDPRKRPSPRLAADILQFYMWAPCHWSLPGFIVTRSEITWWLITMATEVNLGSVNGVNKCQTQNLMKHCFVEKFNMNRVKEVLAFAKMAYKN